MSHLTPYTDFDKAAADEAKRPSPSDFSQSMRRLSALIDQLPQRAAIEDRHAERWLKRTMEMSIQRMELEKGEDNATVADVHKHALWHVRRASAIGGSEIGTVVRHFRNETGGFSNATNLVLEKLLIMAPRPGTEEMNRGVRAEPIIQKMYLDQTKGVSDEAALDRLKEYRWEMAPFLVGTPDDLIIYPDGCRDIIDYKCPSADVNEEYEKKGQVSFDYVCQTHHYGLLAEKSGIPFDGKKVCCFDPRSFKIVEYDIEHDQDLLEEMISSADYLWNNYIMKGLVPDPVGPDQLDNEDPDIKDMVLQAAVLKKIADEVSVRQKDLLKRVYLIAEEEYSEKVGKVDLGFASFERVRKYDEDKLIDLAISVEIETDDFYKVKRDIDEREAAALLWDILEFAKINPEEISTFILEMSEVGLPRKKELDVKSLVKAIEETGASATPASEIYERFGISRAKAQAEMVEKIKIEASRLVETIEDVVAEEARNIIAEPDEMEMEPT